jgi:hypothetical protein
VAQRFADLYAMLIAEHERLTGGRLDPQHA